jgi:DUF1680 family protein
MNYEILGFYVDPNQEIKANTVMVVINEGYKKLTYYCPVGQHGEMDWSYFAECNPITKEQYMEVSKSFYTPKDYLN